MIGVLVSGEGTNLQALIDAGLPIGAVASNRRGAGALARADAAGIPNRVFELEAYADRAARDRELADWLQLRGVDLVVLAGYMHLLTPGFLERFPERIVNVHPSLLPEFPGASALDDALAAGRPERGAFTDVGALGWQLLDDDPDVVAAALLDAIRTGADEEQVGRAIAYAAALRIVRFHVQNDHGDWDTVHHAFTAANGLHQALQRRPTTELLRGAVHAALRINLDRFLNVPAARLPQATSGTLAGLAQCFEAQGLVDEAGNEAYGFLRSGGSRAELAAALGHALLVEDAEFHWYQTVEAGVRQAQQWPEGSEEEALVLVGVARFLAAHTPTRRELPTVVRIATRLRRGEALYEDEDALSA